jgi:predicted CXXCH cytochrome family protein
MIRDYRHQVSALYDLKQERIPTPEALISFSCSGCHVQEYKTWMETKHSSAYSSLAEKKRQFDPECLACHTTRFEETGGFNMKSQPPELIHVQCDSCHGPSEEHGNGRGKISVKNPNKKICLPCHGPDRSPEFEKEYLKYREKVRHKKI